MSTANEITITDFFDLEENLDKAYLDELEKSSAFQEMRKKVKGQLKNSLLPPGFFKLMLTQLFDLLNIDINQLMAQLWSKQKDLEQYCDPEQYPPEETFYVPLMPHTFESKHEPNIEPVINEISLGIINIHVVFTIEVQGAILKIRDGHIEGFSLGDCTGAGLIEILNFTILEKKSEALQFASAVTLEKPVPIDAIKNKVEAITGEVEAIAETIETVTEEIEAISDTVETIRDSVETLSDEKDS